jgi:hypothetical protein
MGVMGHWIDIDKNDGKWKLCTEVLAFRSISGQHTGQNLAQHMVAILKRAQVVTKSSLKVHLIKFFLNTMLTNYSSFV